MNCMGPPASRMTAKRATSSRCSPNFPISGTSMWRGRSATIPKSARFAEEGFQEDYVAFVKTLTTKPVVGVGRFTSPDMMMSQIRRGITRSHRRGAAVDRRSVPAGRRSAKAAKTKSANASAAISAAPPTTSRCRSAARRTRPWARNGGAAGIPKRIAAEASEKARAGRGRRAGGARMRARPGASAAIEVTLAEAPPRAWRAGADGIAPAGSQQLDPGARLSRAYDRQARQC